MPEVSYATIVAAPVERVWNYVEDLHRWRHLMVGYQALEIVDDRRSVWTLRGDVGILSREVKIQVDITEWIPNERVRFVVTGLTERLDGAGSFRLERVASADLAAGDPGSETSGGVAAPPEPVRSREPRLLRRLRFAIVRAMLRRLGRRNERDPAARAGAATAEPRAARNSSASTVSSRLTFELRVSPLGPMAPMLDLLMAPMLEPAAQDLADGIRLAVEA